MNKATNSVILRDSGKNISNTEKVADTFNKFFVNIGNTKKGKRFQVETNYLFDPVLKANKKYSSHSSIVNFKEKMNNNVSSFQNVTYKEILNDKSNSTQSEYIPFKIIKDNAVILPILSYKTLANAS